MKKVHHDLGEEEVKELMGRVWNTVHECVDCGKWVANLSKHRRKGCKGGRVDQPPPTRQEREERVPPAFQRGFPLMKQEFGDYMKLTYPKESTRTQYLNRMNNIMTWWETSIPGFKADSLLYCLDLEVPCPSISDLIKDIASDSMKSTTKKAYKAFTQFLAKKTETT